MEEQKGSVSKKEIHEKGEVDYFFVILRQWKVLLIVGGVALIIGALAIFLKPHQYTASSVFSIRLHRSVSSNYGSYSMKTIDPKAYLDRVTSRGFVDTLLVHLANKGVDTSNAQLSIRLDYEKFSRSDLKNSKVDPLSLGKTVVLSVSGGNKKLVMAAGDIMLPLLKKEEDRLLFEDIITTYRRDLKKSIRSYEVALKHQQIYVQSLEGLKGDAKIPGGINKLGENGSNFSLTNSLEETNNSEKYAALLLALKNTSSYKTVQLVIAKSRLADLIKGLSIKKKRYADLSEENAENFPSFSFYNVFSHQVLVLSPSQLTEHSSWKEDLTKVIAFVLVIEFLLVCLILGRTYYKEAQKG